MQAHPIRRQAIRRRGLAEARSAEAVAPERGVRGTYKLSPERRAKGGLGCPVSHPEHGDTLSLPQKADLPNDFLGEDGKNLGLALNRLQREPKAKTRILEALRKLYEGVSDFGVIIKGGTVQVFFQEGDITVPATRLLDGTLRYLCLLAILCHPTPPPLVCIEEPELGLHPDILPTLSDLLREASERCQLIITTHSDVLVDALTDTPDAVVVCEKHAGRTEMRRLDKTDLADWLQRYSLGALWRSGELGGNRW